MTHGAARIHWGCGVPPYLGYAAVWLPARCLIDSTTPRLTQTYPLNTTASTTVLADLMRHGVKSTDIAAVKGSGCTSEYVTEVQGLWPLNEIPPGAPQFPDSRQAKNA